MAGGRLSGGGEEKLGKVRCCDVLCDSLGMGCPACCGHANMERLAAARDLIIPVVRDFWLRQARASLRRRGERTVATELDDFALGHGWDGGVDVDVPQWASEGAQMPAATPPSSPLGGPPRLSSALVIGTHGNAVGSPSRAPLHSHADGPTARGVSESLADRKRNRRRRSVKPKPPPGLPPPSARRVPQRDPPLSARGAKRMDRGLNPAPSSIALWRQKVSRAKPRRASTHSHRGSVYSDAFVVGDDRLDLDTPAPPTPPSRASTPSDNEEGDQTRDRDGEKAREDPALQRALLQQELQGAFRQLAPVPEGTTLPSKDSLPTFPSFREGKEEEKEDEEEGEGGEGGGGGGRGMEDVGTEVKETGEVGESEEEDGEDELEAVRRAAGGYEETRRDGDGESGEKREGNAGERKGPLESLFLESSIFTGPLPAGLIVASSLMRTDTLGSGGIAAAISVPQVGGLSSTRSQYHIVASGSDAPTLPARVIEDYKAEEAGELSVGAGDLVLVLDQDVSGWWEVELLDLSEASAEGDATPMASLGGGSMGYVPCTFLQWVSAAELEAVGIEVAGEVAAALETIVAREQGEEVAGSKIKRAKVGSGDEKDGSGESGGTGAGGEGGGSLWHLDPHRAVWSRIDPATGEEETSVDPFATGIGTELARRADAIWDGKGDPGILGDDGEDEVGSEDTRAAESFICHSEYVPGDAGEVALHVGDEVLVWEKDESGWWEGQNVATGEAGWMPASYLATPDGRDAATASAHGGEVTELPALITSSYEPPPSAEDTAPPEPFPIGQDIIVGGFDDSKKWAFAAAAPERTNPQWIPITAIQWCC